MIRWKAKCTIDGHTNNTINGEETEKEIIGEVVSQPSGTNNNKKYIIVFYKNRLIPVEIPAEGLEVVERK